MVHIKHRTRHGGKLIMKGAPRYRSRTFRKVQRKTPGSKTVVQYIKRNPSVAHCGSCKNPLHGLPRARDRKIKHFSRTQLTTQRPFGNLCSSCSRDIIRWRARVQHKLARPDEIPISYRQYVKVGA
ncbi:MAG TPA: hypothetical protein VJ110_01980 [Candidatus Nanoarchaeia archaeon]|nr:hypothetical protein [Candidatus Nanoarchaeia archaeon]